MSISRTENSINPLHLVTPDRVIVPMPKAFDAPPGVKPFHRMLEVQNLLVANTPAPERAPIAREHDSFESTKTIGLLPKLGEVLPVTPIANEPVKVQRTTQVQQPATGRLLDLYL